MAERGSRRAAADAQRRRQAGTRSTSRGRSQGRTERTGWRLWLRRLVVWGGAAALLGALFLGLAVAFAARSLPSYSALKATQPGQTIVVRARDGSEIVELGPSYGKWLDSGQTPQVMKDA